MSLQQGIRPDIVIAVNSFAVIHGVRVFLRPSARGRKNSAGLSVVESLESELESSVENALRGGSMPEGILALTKTLTGGIKVIPVKGKPFTADNTKMLARILDRKMLQQVNILDWL